MKLYASPTTPFGRKVIMTAMIKGVWPSIELIGVDPTGPGAASLAAANPLGKIPALVLDDGTALFDSPVICEYLDRLTPAPRLVPLDGPERWRVLTQQALADGILDAAVLIVYEGRLREPEQRSAAWIERQQAKIDAGLAHLEATIDRWSAHLDLGTITAAVVLGYLDLRQGDGWRARHPRLAGWHDQVAGRDPAYLATRPPT